MKNHFAALALTAVIAPTVLPADSPPERVQVMLCHRNDNTYVFPFIQTENGSVSVLGMEDVTATKGASALTMLREDTVVQLHDDQMQVMEKGTLVSGMCTDITDVAIQLVEILTLAELDRTLQLGGIIPDQRQDATQRNAGPPMTSREREVFRASILDCWNVGALSSEALRTTVTVAFSMGEDRRPDSIRQVSFDGGSAEAARQTFESARRAILRCGASGLNVPPEKFDQWRDVE